MELTKQSTTRWVWKRFVRVDNFIDCLGLVSSSDIVLNGVRPVWIYDSRE